jgi:hypothetical protein
VWLVEEIERDRERERERERERIRIFEKKHMPYAKMINYRPGYLI